MRLLRNERIAMYKCVFIMAIADNVVSTRELVWSERFINLLDISKEEMDAADIMSISEMFSVIRNMTIEKKRFLMAFVDGMMVIDGNIAP